MDSVIVQYERPATRRHDVHHLSPGASLRFGRGAPGVHVDLVIEHPGVPRLAGAIAAVADHWQLSNLSRDLTYLVEDPEGAGAHVKVAARRLDAPIPFELSKIRVPVADGAVELIVFAPQHRYADRDAVDLADGDTTTSPFSLDESAKYFLVLVALCEPRLRNSTSVALPSDKELLARLRPLAGCEELTRSAVNFHIDYLARVKLRLRDTGDEPSTEGRRNGLVNFALRFDLVRDEHLALLRPPT